MPRNTSQPHLGVVMADVAARAGVSVQTVSRVFRDAPGASEATRQKVFGEARKLEYRPNRVAQTLATGQSRTVGVLINRHELFGPSTGLYGILDAAREAGFFVLVDTIHSVGVEEQKKSVNDMIGQGVGGILIAGPQYFPRQLFDEFDPTFPMVVLGVSASPHVPAVDTNVSRNVKLILDHLLDLGHRHFGFVAGQKGDPAATSKRSRFVAAVRRLQLPKIVVAQGDWSPASGYAAASAFEENPEITAIIASNDQMAIGLITGLQRRGLNIPGDISVVGFDDFPEAAWINPPLTSIRIDQFEQGRQAFALIHSRITNQTRNSPNVVLASELIIRESTGIARNVTD